MSTATTTISNEPAAQHQHKQPANNEQQHAHLLIDTATSTTSALNLKFVAESCLGKVARHLRLLGIDTAWDKSYNVHYVQYLARHEQRTVLVQSDEFYARILKEMPGSGSGDNSNNNSNNAGNAANGGFVPPSKKHFDKKKQNKNNKSKSKKQQAADDYSDDDDYDEDDDDFLANIPPQYQEFLSQQQQQHQAKLLLLQKQKQEQQQKQNSGNQHQHDASDAPQSTSYQYYKIDKDRDYLDQITELTNYFKIQYHPQDLFKRCLKCNSIIVRVPRPDKREDDPTSWDYLEQEMGAEAFSKYSTTVTKCNKCNKLFWQGHYYHKCEKFAQKYSYHPEDEQEQKQHQDNNDEQLKQNHQDNKQDTASD